MVAQSPQSSVSSASRASVDLFGSRRTIGFFGGVCMLTNVVVGPGIVEFPALFQQTGWLLCSLSITLIASLALLNSWMMIYAHSGLSKRTVSRLEFIDMCQILLPRWAYLLAFVFYVATMYALCLASILQIMQVMDFLVGYLGGGRTCAFELYGPNPMSWQCVPIKDDEMDASLFPAGSGVISIGMVLCAAFTVPFGFWPLEDNIAYQTLATVAMYVAIAVWLCTFVVKGLEPAHVPLVGVSANRLIGVTLFNFALPFTLPSWNNERHLSVSPLRSILAAILWGSSGMLVLGVMAAMALPAYYGTDVDLLSMINDPRMGFGWPAKTAMFLFTLMNTATGIPVFSIILRYNFLSATNPLPFLRPKFVATFMAVALPWIVAIPLYTVDGFSHVVDVAGTCIGSVVNFILPVLLFVLVLRLERVMPLEAAALAKIAAARGEPVEDPHVKQLRSRRQYALAKAGAAVTLSFMCAAVGVGLYDVSAE